MDFAVVSWAAALFRMQVTQPSGSRPCTPRTTAKAVTEDDTAELPTFGVQRGAAVAECDCLQLGQPVAVPGTAQKDRQLVADEPAAAVVKTGDRLVEHARYYWLLLAESHLTRRLFGAMVRRIELLPLPAGSSPLPVGRISGTSKREGEVSERSRGHGSRCWLTPS